MSRPGTDPDDSGRESTRRPHAFHQQAPVIAVRLFDQHANPLARVHVEAVFSIERTRHHAPGHARQTACTDAEGEATFRLLPPHQFVLISCRGRAHGPFAVDAGDTIALVL